MEMGNINPRNDEPNQVDPEETNLRRRCVGPLKTLVTKTINTLIAKKITLSDAIRECESNATQDQLHAVYVAHMALHAIGEKASNLEKEVLESFDNNTKMTDAACKKKLRESLEQHIETKEIPDLLEEAHELIEQALKVLAEFKYNPTPDQRDVAKFPFETMILADIEEAADKEPEVVIETLAPKKIGVPPRPSDSTDIQFIDDSFTAHRIGDLRISTPSKTNLGSSRRQSPSREVVFDADNQYLDTIQNNQLAIKKALEKNEAAQKFRAEMEKQLANKKAAEKIAEEKHQAIMKATRERDERDKALLAELQKNQRMEEERIEEIRRELAKTSESPYFRTDNSLPFHREEETPVTARAETMNLGNRSVYSTPMAEPTNSRSATSTVYKRRCQEAEMHREYPTRIYDMTPEQLQQYYNQRIKCVFCEGAHSIDKCPNAPQQYREIISRLNTSKDQRSIPHHSDPSSDDEEPENVRQPAGKETPIEKPPSSRGSIPTAKPQTHPIFQQSYPWPFYYPPGMPGVPEIPMVPGMHSFSPKPKNTQEAIDNIRPRFTGDPVMLPAFLANFKELVEDNPYLADAMKFGVLSTVIEGKATSCLVNTADARTSIDQTLKMLKNTYGTTATDKYALEQELRALTFEQINPYKMVDSLNQFLKKIATMKDAGYENEATSISELLFKLPKNMHVKLRQEAPSYTTFEAFVDRVRQLVEKEKIAFDYGKQTKGHQKLVNEVPVASQEVVFHANASTQQNYNNQSSSGGKQQSSKSDHSAKKKDSQKKKRNFEFTKNPWETRAKTARWDKMSLTMPEWHQDQQKTCIMCGPGHTSEACTLDPKEVRDRIQSESRCTNCGRTGHKLVDCKMLGKKSCIHCSNHHLTSGCYNRTAQQQQFRDADMGKKLMINVLDLPGAKFFRGPTENNSQ